MRPWIVRLLCGLMLVAVAVAQDTPPAQQPAPPQQTPPADQNKDSKDKDKKDKKDKKKKDKDKDSGTDVMHTDSAFTEVVANDVLATLRDGLEGHSQRLMLSAFDGDKMDGYLSFEDAIEAMMNKYDGFRVHYRILQSEATGSKGVVLTQFDMEEIPRDAGTNPKRRSTQIRFELERGQKGWRIIDFSPRDFFS